MRTWRWTWRREARRAYVRGGLGDVLLSLEDALRLEEVDVYSHSKAAPDLLRPFGLRVAYHPFTAAGRTAVKPPGRELPRRRYPRFPIPAAPLDRARHRTLGSRVVGIHPIGSDFSEEVLRARDRAPKRMSAELVADLVASMDDGDTSFLLFCAPEEQPLFPIDDPSLALVGDPDIWDALACVSRCHLVIGVDSVIKTMAALLRIPTLVLVGDHRDRFRDRFFIRPYVEDGVMRVLKSQDPGDLSAGSIREAAAALALRGRPRPPLAG